MVIDSITTLISCVAIPGDQLHCAYQISLPKSEVDSASLRQYGTESLANRNKFLILTFALLLSFGVCAQNIEYKKPEILPA